MRALKLVLTATGFAAYFLGMIALSAVATGAIHSALAQRPAGTTVNGN